MLVVVIGDDRRETYLRWSAVGFGLGRNVRGDVKPEEELAEG